MFSFIFAWLIRANLRIQSQVNGYCTCFRYNVTYTYCFSHQGQALASFLIMIWSFLLDFQLVYFTVNVLDMSRIYLRISSGEWLKPLYLSLFMMYNYNKGGTSSRSKPYLALEKTSSNWTTSGFDISIQPSRPSICIVATNTGCMVAQNNKNYFPLSETLSSSQVPS